MCSYLKKRLPDSEMTMTPEREKKIRHHHLCFITGCSTCELFTEIDRLRDKIDFVTEALDNANGPPYVARNIVVNEHDVFLLLDKLIKKLRG